MKRKAISFQRRDMHRGRARHGRISSLFLQFAIPLALPVLLCACAPAVLTPKDRTAIDSGDKGLVLVRVLCTVDGTPFEPCVFRRNEPVLSDRAFVGVALGSFDTFGQPGPVAIRALSDESLDEGWACLVLSPGVYYLYVRGPDSRASHCSGAECVPDPARVPYWRIDVPERARLIYAGTVTLAGKENGTLMFGEKIIVAEADQEAPVRDERASADRLLARHFPGTEIHNLPMRRWRPGEPFVFRSPLPGAAIKAGFSRDLPFTVIKN